MINRRSCWKSLLGCLALSLVPCAAFAYLPPAFFVYSRLTDQKTKTAVTGVAITVARPQAGGTEEILGTLSIPEIKPAIDGWPTLSLIFSPDHTSLVRSVTAFGLKVIPEGDLQRVEREKLTAMKDPPAPFYKPDPTMSLKRTRQTYAWVHSNEAGRSVWIEKDSFLPLKVAAPCPAGASSLSWAKSGDNQCEVEFRNLAALRRGSFQNARITLWKDGVPLLFLTFDKLATTKSKLPIFESKLEPDVKDVVETILH